MARFFFSKVLAFASSICLIVASNPFQLSPSSTYYGPDGPWQAVSVTIGENQGSIDLFPGGIASSFIMTSKKCSQNVLCGSGGIYDKNASGSYNQLAAPRTVENGSYHQGVINIDWTLEIGVDKLVLSSSSSLTPSLTVPNFEIAIASDLNMTIGDGVSYPLQAGQLSLGQTSEILANNISLIPGKLEAQKDIPSSSFGLHYGSAALGPKLSLLLGGYDQQRLVGAVSAQPVDRNTELSIDLLDIGIGVETGGSPFPFSTKQGLLTSNNASIGTSLTVTMNPYSPYLALPGSTCNAIAAVLPVIYNETLNLYLWNTTSPAYKPIVTSPSFLSFTFRLSGSSNANFSINIPFTLLNLTLDQPLVQEPTPYLPCQPPSAFDVNYSLGRPFLQGAFIGADWDKQPGEWYLAQAPGPNIASQPDPIAIGGNSTATVNSSANSWADTWKDTWTPLAGDGATPANLSLTASTGRLSKGAIAGIVIGALVGMGVLTGGALSFLTRRRRWKPTMAAQQKAPPLLSRPEFKSEMGEDDIHEMAGGEPRELYGVWTQKGDVELEGPVFGELTGTEKP